MLYRTFKELSLSTELIASAVAGDRKAVNQLLEAIQGPVYNLALRFFFEHEDAEDATQEILLRTVRKLASFRGDSAFSTWLYTLATRHLLNAKRGRYEGLRIDDGYRYLAEGMAAPSYTGPDAPLLEQEVKLGCTTSLLVCLSREQRLAYILGEILDLPAPEASAVLEIAPSLFRKRLSLARKKVRAFFAGQCGHFNPTNPCRCARQISYNLASGWLDPDAPRFLGGTSQAELQRMSQALDEVGDEVAIYRNQPSAKASTTLLARVLADLDQPISFS